MVHLALHVGDIGQIDCGIQREVSAVGLELAAHLVIVDLFLVEREIASRGWNDDVLKDGRIGDAEVVAARTITAGPVGIDLAPVEFILQAQLG